jgi:hypothetical protein
MAEERRLVPLRLPVSLIDRVDVKAGKGKRTAFVIDALEAAVEGSAPAAGESEFEVRRRRARMRKEGWFFCPTLTCDNYSKDPDVVCPDHGRLVR